jgi:hypothetical protein
MKALISEYYSVSSYMGDRRGACKVLIDNLKRGDSFEFLFVDGMIILTLYF